MRGIFRIESCVEMGILGSNAQKTLLEGMPHMKMKSNVLVYLLVVILTLQVVPVSAQGETPPPAADVTVSEEPSNEDASWPITSKETQKRRDLSTGQEIVETIVVRQRPSGKDNSDCSKKRMSKLDLAALATCYYSVSIERSAIVYVGGGAVTSIVKGFADKY